MSDEPMHDLAARLARGDEAAFAQLYDACADRLHRYLALRLGSTDAASDVLQTAFLRAVKSRRRFARVTNPVAYLFQIARNEALRDMSRGNTRIAADAAVVDRDAPKVDTANAADAEIVSAAL